MTDFPSYLHRHDMIADLAAAAEADREETEAQAETNRRQRAAEEAAVIALAEASSEKYRTDEPPDTVAIATNGLSPMRARLCNFVAWLAALEAEHASLVKGREKYLSDQGVPAMTMAALKKMESDDKTGLIAAIMASGTGTLTRHQLRGAERAKLAEKLKADEYAAGVAVEAIADVEQRIDTLSRGIEIVRGRHSRFVADCLQEIVCTTAGERLSERAAALQASEVDVLGATACLARLRNLHHEPRAQSIALPQMPFEVVGIGGVTRPGYVIPGQPGIAQSIELTIPAQAAAAARWTDLAKQLLADPHADISGAI